MENNYAFSEPTQEVVETDDGVYIDGFKIEYVKNDSVTTEPFGKSTIVTLSFFAKSFTKACE